METLAKSTFHFTGAIRAILAAKSTDSDAISNHKTFQLSYHPPFVTCIGSINSVFVKKENIRMAEV